MIPPVSRQRKSMRQRQKPSLYKKPKEFACENIEVGYINAWVKVTQTPFLRRKREWL